MIGRPMTRPVIEPDVGAGDERVERQVEELVLRRTGWLRVGAVAARRGE
jgi:hypothetical protein